MPGNSGTPSRESRSDADAKAVFERLFRSGRLNGLLAWLVVGVLATVFLESALDLDYQWLAFVTGVGVIVLIPPAAYRDWRIMLPWELLVLATLPILVRGLFGGSVGTFAAYLAVAGLALASVAAWTVLRWNLDRTVGTSYLSTNEVLMAEWLSVTVAGLAAGVLFDAYFRRRDRQLRRALRRVVRR